ncbi:MAG: AAA family ATPase [Candidatus Syntrophoarchaeum sp.]|nr:AAA family ATPase [Candidatus Syntrophoarchaeum sp.]
MADKGRIIAITGKGGTGKTVVSTLFVRFLSEQDVPLAIDADPASSLPAALGIEVNRTIGDLREEIAQPSAIPFDQSMPTDMMLERKIGELLVNTPDFSILTMGRSEGPGCYCLINDILRHAIDRFSKRFATVVIDCEAGLEHLSRRTMRDVDTLIVVSDPTMRGIKTAGVIREISDKLEISFGKIYLILNKADDEERAFFEDKIKEVGVELIGVVPQDANVKAFDKIGKPLIDLPDDSPAVVAVRDIVERLGLMRE